MSNIRSLSKQEALQQTVTTTVLEARLVFEGIKLERNAAVSQTFFNHSLFLFTKPLPLQLLFNSLSTSLLLYYLFTSLSTTHHHPQPIFLLCSPIISNCPLTLLSTVLCPFVLRVLIVSPRSFRSPAILLFIDLLSFFL